MLASLYPSTLDAGRPLACRAALWACRRCELMGRKKDCAANEGTWVRLARLVELGGLLEFVTDPPGPLNVPPVRHGPMVVGELIPPLRNWDACAEGRVCDDIAEPGRLGSFEVAVIGLCPFAVPSLLNSSPSSEAMSVMREDMTLGARVEPPVVKGVGNEFVVGERAEAGECGCSIVVAGTFYRRILIVILVEQLGIFDAQCMRLNSWPERG